MRLALLLVVAAALSIPPATAQMSRSRERSGSPREAYRDRDTRPGAAPATDPIAALERELPSLKVDIHLTAAQVATWSAFERDVREVAEMDRSRRKRAMALKDVEESKRTAIAVVGGIAEDDRARAEASADLTRDLQSLYGLLEETQRRMLDRRVVMSQTEPLDNAPPAR